nr:Vacuolar protein sorting-associated protein 53 [Polyrhizophydium stewartii]
MTKRPWGTLPAVGDQSEHITAIAATLSQNIKIIRATIASSKYFRLFCDKFAESFTAKYLANIYKCRPLSEVGAEQMLLDTHALKNILTEMSTLGADPPAAAPPAAYVKILAKGITKIEQLLKVVLRPQDPPDIIVDTYNLLYADYSIGNFQKILELKALSAIVVARVADPPRMDRYKQGLRRSEMQPILDVFQIKIPAGAQPAASAAPAAPADATRGAAAAAAAAAIGMGAFKSDFRKFMNNMNIKRT